MNKQYCFYCIPVLEIARSEKAGFEIEKNIYEIKGEVEFFYAKNVVGIIAAT